MSEISSIIFIGPIIFLKGDMNTGIALFNLHAKKKGVRNLNNE